jgi:hypothetical protein
MGTRISQSGGERMIDKNNLDTQVNFRCTAQEKEELEQKAVAFGFRTLTAFIMWALKTIKKEP